MKLILENWRKYISEEEERSKLGAKGKHVDVDSKSSLGDNVTDDVVQLVKTSYDKLGGFPRLETPSGLKNTITNYYLVDVDDDPEPDAGMLYYDAGNYKKASAIVTDGGPEAKKIIPQTMKKLLSQPGYWIEVSGAPAHIMINKLGLKPIADAELAEFLVSFGGKRDVNFNWLGETDKNKIGGDGWYVRDAGDKKIIKTIVGNVNRKMFGLEK
jgi:hypothetical protein